MNFLKGQFLLLVSLLSFISCQHLEGQKMVKTQADPELAIIKEEIVVDTNWTEKFIQSDEYWSENLSKAEYNIAREKGTERPFSHAYNKNKKKGLYACVACGNPLFDAKKKYDSGSGWPSFWKPFFSKSVAVGTDNSHGMTRDEVTCAKCDSHLGHVFNDGPDPTGLRYCMNGTALNFYPEVKLEKVVFAQGCFWCTEEIFEAVKGVEGVVSGYAGGRKSNAKYKEVGSGRTNHVEAIEITYNPSIISYQELLKVYFNSGDITQVNGQGNDHGAQYRSVVYYNDEGQKNQVLNYIKMLEASSFYSKGDIAVEVSPFSTFYEAEEYHQDYVKLNPDQSYVRGVSIPRYKKAIKNFPELLKK